MLYIKSEISQSVKLKSEMLLTSYMQRMFLFFETMKKSL